MKGNHCPPGIRPEDAFRIHVQVDKYTASIDEKTSVEMVRQEFDVWFDLRKQYSLSKFVDEMAANIMWGSDQQLIVWGLDRESNTEWKVTTDEKFREMIGARCDVKKMDLICEVLDKEKDNNPRLPEMDVSPEVLDKDKDSTRLSRCDGKQMDISPEVLEKDKDSTRPPRCDAKAMDVSPEVLEKDKESSRLPRWDAKEMDVNCELLDKDSSTSRLLRSDEGKANVPNERKVHAKSGVKADQPSFVGKENEDVSSNVCCDSLAIERVKVKLKLTPSQSKEIREYMLKREEAVDTLEVHAEPPSNCSDHNKVFIIYDKRMNQHRQFSDDAESAKRIPRILANLKKNGLLSRCVVSSKATSIDESLVLEVHSETYIEFIKKLPLRNTKLEPYLEFLSDNLQEREEFVSSKGTPLAAFLAAGAVVEACNQVAMGNCCSSFAIVRPPGHHAKESTANGFCFLNNVAIGARYLQRVHNAKKILVVDFDVHHGDGTQEIFYQDDTVLFCSIHREKIFPRSEKKCVAIGEGKGKGFNVNVSLVHPLVNNDLLASFDFLFLPIAKQYKPDYVLVSAGYDSAIGDELGESYVTPDCFAQLVRKLKSISDGRLVLALEGGYNLDSLAESCSESVKELLDNETQDNVKCRLEDVDEQTLTAIDQAKSALAEFWPCLDEVDSDLT